MALIRNKLGGVLAIIGGLFLFISGSVGLVGLLSWLGDFVQKQFGENEIISIIFKILVFFAMLGGITVMLAGILIWKKYARAGKFLIVLGTSIGLIGLLIGILIAVYQGKFDNYVTWLTSSFSGLGILLALMAYYLAKP